MKEIPLTDGKVALVDNADFEWLNQWKWHVKKKKNTFYASRRKYQSDTRRYKTIYMHRQILGITDSKIFGEHIDHNGLNNQRNNLRTATRAQNGMNRTAKVNGTSKYLGVSWDKSRNKWIAQIRTGNKVIKLGGYHSEKEAALEYNKAALEYHKEFANPNIIE